ncbi:phosphate acyltransferase, partial [Porphyromonas gingivalis]|uniref:phosphate acyltransferase n=1 Tax=Porphyromonas gingivalis TaxID=837 RepID=UPI0015CF5703
AHGIARPIMLGDEKQIRDFAAELDLSLEGIKIVNYRSDEEKADHMHSGKVTDALLQADSLLGHFRQIAMLAVYARDHSIGIP